MKGKIDFFFVKIVRVIHVTFWYNVCFLNLFPLNGLLHVNVGRQKESIRVIIFKKNLYRHKARFKTNVTKFK